MPCRASSCENQMSRGRKGFVSSKDWAGVRAHFLMLSSAAGPAQPLDCPSPCHPREGRSSPFPKVSLSECGWELVVGEGVVDALGETCETPLSLPSTPGKTGVRFFLLRVLSCLLPPASPPTPLRHSPKSLGLALGLGLTSRSLPRVRTSRLTPQ